ncbi:MAG: FAD-dependent oxidoreductase [Phormidesmis sp.]
MNAPVRWLGSSKGRSLELQNRQVRVVTAQGNFYGKRVILALPPQIIAKISLDTALSTLLHERPHHFVLGKVIKNVVVYESAWWRSLGLSGAADTPSEPVEFLADTSQPEQSGILVALASGSKAVKLSQMDEETRKATVLFHISKVLGTAPSPPTGFFSMDWINQQYSCGGYASRRAMRDWVNKKDALARPVGLIHFAGTETAVE